MKQLRIAALYLAGGLAGGFALSALLVDDEPSSPTPAAVADAELVRRMAQLESRLDSVVAANTALSSELERIGTLLETYAADSSAADPDAGRPPPWADDEDDAALPPPARAELEQRRRARNRGLAERLTDAGFSAADATHIETRVEELRVAAMQSRYEALRSGERPTGPGLDATAPLRAELGDAQFERFLEATGRPTRVNVRSVLASSAAETAGIQSGDQILAYGGERVFDSRDLNRVLLDGEPGEPVVVDVVRDGQPIQVVIPRGPLGISSGRRGGG